MSDTDLDAALALLARTAWDLYVRRVSDSTASTKSLELMMNIPDRHWLVDVFVPFPLSDAQQLLTLYLSGVDGSSSLRYMSHTLSVSNASRYCSIYIYAIL